MDVNAKLAAQQAARIVADIAAATPPSGSRAIIAPASKRMPVTISVPEPWLANQTAR